MKKPVDPAVSDSDIHYAAEINSIELKDNSGFSIGKTKFRNKVSKYSGLKARERLSIDRSRAHVTIKEHLVEEQLQPGQWVVVHNEVETFLAKRRPHTKGKDY